MMQKKTYLSEAEVEQVKVFWNYIEANTGLKYPIPEKDLHKIPSQMSYMKKLCGEQPFDPIYAAKRHLNLHNFQ